MGKLYRAMAGLSANDELWEKTENEKAAYDRGIPIPSESDEQKALFQWAELHYGKHPVLRKMYHIPNGGKRGKAEAARFKAEGVKPGMPDIHLPTARGGFHSLYIEMKKIIGGRLSQDQKDRIADLEQEGNRVVVCMGWEDAAKEIMKYISLEG